LTLRLPHGHFREAGLPSSGGTFSQFSKILKKPCQISDQESNAEVSTGDWLADFLETLQVTVFIAKSHDVYLSNPCRFHIHPKYLH
jgi:hypothetical protein